MEVVVAVAVVEVEVEVEGRWCTGMRMGVGWRVLWRGVRTVQMTAAQEIAVVAVVLAVAAVGAVVVF